MRLAGWAAGVPVEPSREQARGWAIEELSGREYAAARPGVVERVLTWLMEQLQKIESSDDPISVVALTAALTLIAVVLAWAIRRAGGLRRAARRVGPAVLDSPYTSAAQHREAADRFADALQWGPAVLERFRAIARTLEEQAVLLPQPGRTAAEVAGDAGVALPDLAADLTSAARLFDDVCYGDRAADAGANARLRALDDRVRQARPVSASTVGTVRAMQPGAPPA